MRILEPLLWAYTFWADHLPAFRGRGLILRAVDVLQRRGVSAPVITSRDGIRIEFGTDYVARDIFYRGEWEPEETALLRSVTPAGGTFVDVGANIGYFTLLASRWVGPTGRVIALEPVASTYRRLRRNLELNGAGNVTTLQCGASARSGTAKMAVGGDAGHSHLVRDEDAATAAEGVALTTVDELVEAHGLRRLDVLKVDVEGADFDVIRGAATTLRRLRPVVLMEVELIQKFGASIEQVEAFMESLDYRCEVLRHRSATDMLCRPH